MINEVSQQDLSWVLIKPRLTEKAAALGSENTYTFDVAPRSNKIQIKNAIKKYYKVDPIKITVIVTKPQRVVVRGRRGQKSGAKKAMVTLKKGQTIDFT